MTKRIATLGIMLAGLAMTAPDFHAQAVDLCGCASFPGLQPFDSANAATFPPGTSDNGSTLTLQIPDDGVFRFASFRVTNRQVAFSRNNANSPVVILVSGDVSIASTQGCCYGLVASGASGSGGSAQLAGVGGGGGPGGARGGDGAALALNGASIGGAGFGPGGGAGGTATPFANGGGATFLSIPELVPLAGGSGGGGGSSTSASTTSCSGGGGGGGGGAILIAANGTLTLRDYQLFVDGGTGGGSGNGSCASSGGGGSGGAIRLVAARFVAQGNTNVLARGLNNGGGDGRIRLESIDTSAQTAFNTQPAAFRVVGPSPLTNPVNPTVRITSVAGSAPPAVPLGTFGSIDVTLPAPGPVPVTLATTGVPGGTTLQVTVKPRIGGAMLSQTVPLSACDGGGACSAVATFDLVAGAYVVEARATFQLQ